MKKLALYMLVCLWTCAVPVAGQQKPAAKSPPPAAPQEFVREWFRRWNALDGSDAAAKRFVDLYQPTGIHQTEPSEKQIGPVFYEGHEALRKLADDFAQSAIQPAFRIDRTPAGADAKGVELFFMSRGPWDGPAVGVQYTGEYTERATKKRYSFPGFAVFHIEDGKIRYARFYTTRDEKTGGE